MKNNRSVVFFCGISALLFACVTAAAGKSTTPAELKNEFFVNWYVPLVDEDAVSSVEMEPLFNFFAGAGVDVTVRGRKDLSENINAVLSRRISDWIHPLSTGLASRGALTAMETRRLVGSEKAARAQRWQINVVVANNGTDGTNSVPMLPSHHNILRLRFGESVFPLPNIAIESLLSWDEVWVAARAVKQRILLFAEKWAEFAAIDALVADPNFNNNNNPNPNPNATTTNDDDKDEEKKKERERMLAEQKAKQLARLPPIRVMPTAFDADKWRYYKDDISPQRRTDNVLFGRVGPYVLPDASFRILSIVDMRKSDWSVGPRQYLTLRTTPEDGAHYLLLVEEPPTPGMSAVEVVNYVRDELATAFNPGNLQQSFNFTESGVIPVPTPLPNTISVLYNDNRTALTNAEMLELLNNCHLFAAFSLGEHAETFFLRAMAAELPILTLDTAWPNASLTKNTAVLLPNINENPLEQPRFQLNELTRLVRALMDPTSTDALRARAIQANELLRTRFDPERVGQTIAKRFKSIVKNLNKEGSSVATHLPPRLVSPKQKPAGGTAPSS